MAERTNKRRRFWLNNPQNVQVQIKDFQYENTFESLDQSISQYYPSLIPKDIWISHILKLLSLMDKKSLRATCRGFLYFVTQTLYFSVSITSKNPVNMFIDFKRKYINWPTEIHNVNVLVKTWGSYSIVELHTQLPQLTSLDIGGCDWLPYIPRFTALINLNMSSCTKITNYFMNLSENLTSLDLSYCNLNGFEKMYLPKLKHLSVEGCAEANIINFLPTGLVSLNLEELSLSLRLSDFKALPTTLMYLNLSWWCGLTSSCLKKLPPRLHTLWLNHCISITEKDLGLLPSTISVLRIQSCRQIRSLELSVLPSNIIKLDAQECINLKYVSIAVARLLQRGREIVLCDRSSPLKWSINKLDC